MLKIARIKNLRRGLATNSSSTHSLIYRNDGEVFKDLGIFDNDYYDRCTRTIAASREAKIKYILAAIWRNNELVTKLSEIYPEMKEYFPLVKKQWENDEARINGEEWFKFEDDEIFGMYCRGDFTKGGTEVSMSFLRHVIDSDDIIIVGGSDEQDFVYDTIEGHDEIPVPDDCDDYNYTVGNKNKITRNGNYYVAFGGGDGYKKSLASGGRLRFMTCDGEPTPQYPELIDLRITNRCYHGCKFCFMNSNMMEQDADISNLISIVRELKTQTEFSIGGGNVLLYPELKRLFAEIDGGGHIVNTTINVKDCETILNNPELRKIFEDYVDGIGISVFGIEDVEEFAKFRKEFRDIGSHWGDKLYDARNTKHIVMHLVPEYIGFEKTMEIIKWAQKKNNWTNILFLGYKDVGRGALCEHEKFTDIQLDEIFRKVCSVAIDTSFAKTYGDYIKKNFSTKYTLTENEGEYSMYIDGISMNAYKSSYETDKPYYLGWDKGESWMERRNNHNTIESAFAKIRQDNGFEAYVEKHYWDD